MAIGFALVIVLGSVALMGFLLSLALKQSERAHQNVVQLAKRLGLTVAPADKRFGLRPTPTAAGTIRGKPARLYAYTTGSGKSRTRWAALAVRPAATGGLTFQLGRQGLGTRIAQLFGAREITVGDAAFDNTWFIRTNEPEFFQAALVPELRARLTAACDHSGRAHGLVLKLDSDTVVYAEIGDFADEHRCERIGRMSEVLCDLAAVAEVCAQLKAKA